MIKNGNVYRHRRVYNASVGGFNAAGVYEEKFNTDKDAIYEFFLPLNEPVVTITFESDEKMLQGKEPFEIDMDKLPHESKMFKSLNKR